MRILSFLLCVLCPFLAKSQDDFVILSQGDTLYGFVFPSVNYSSGDVKINYKSTRKEKPQQFVNEQVKAFLFKGKLFLVKEIRGKKRNYYNYFVWLSQGDIDLAMLVYNDYNVYWLFLKDGRQISFTISTFKERALPILRENPRYKERFGEIPLNLPPYRSSFTEELTNLINICNGVFEIE